METVGFSLPSFSVIRVLPSFLYHSFGIIVKREKAKVRHYIKLGTISDQIQFQLQNSTLLVGQIHQNMKTSLISYVWVKFNFGRMQGQVCFKNTKYTLIKLMNENGKIILSFQNMENFKS